MGSRRVGLEENVVLAGHGSVKRLRVEMSVAGGGKSADWKTSECTNAIRLQASQRRAATNWDKQKRVAAARQKSNELYQEAWQ